MIEIVLEIIDTLLYAARGFVLGIFCMVAFAVIMLLL